jgi:hypothetical protein
VDVGEGGGGDVGPQVDRGVLRGRYVALIVALTTLLPREIEA